MLDKIGRLFIIKTRFEAFLIIYALALGAVERGSAYLAGAKMLDCIGHEKRNREAAEGALG